MADLDQLKHLVEEILTKNFNKAITIEIINTTTPAGASADVIKARVQNFGDEIPNFTGQTLIAKVAKLDSIGELVENLSGSKMDEDKWRANRDFIRAIHKRECQAYEIMGKDIPLPIPKCYGFSIGDDEKVNRNILLLEDVADRAASVESIANGLSLSQWKNVVDSMADLNAWSLTTSIKWADTISDLASLTRAVESMVQDDVMKIERMKDKHPAYFGHINEELIKRELVSKKYNASMSAYKSFMPSVLQHGDLWTNNIMFEKNPDGSLSDKVGAIIDWQVLSSGSGLYDLSRLAVFSVPHQIRHEHELEILRYYHQKMTQKSNGKFVVDFDQMKQYYFRLSALAGFIFLVANEIFLHFIEKSKETDKIEWRKKEILERIKVAYDDGEKYFLTNN